MAASANQPGISSKERVQTGEMMCNISISAVFTPDVRTVSERENVGGERTLGSVRGYIDEEGAEAPMDKDGGKAKPGWE